MSPGPHRDVTLTDAQIKTLVRDAKRMGKQAEQLRQKMLTMAAARQALIVRLADGGLSVRTIAQQLDVGTTVVADAIKRGRNT